MNTGSAILDLPDDQIARIHQVEFGKRADGYYALARDIDGNVITEGPSSLGEIAGGSTAFSAMGWTSDEVPDELSTHEDGTALVWTRGQLWSPAADVVSVQYQPVGESNSDSASFTKVVTHLDGSTEVTEGVTDAHAILMEGMSLLSHGFTYEAGTYTWTRENLAQFAA